MHNSQQKKKQVQNIGLLPAHSYTILKVVEIFGESILNIKNPFSQIHWDGDWSQNSKNWTKQVRDMLQPNFTNNDNFWMKFEDFQQYFKSINVCRTKNWEEVRLKGKFLRIQDKNNPTQEIVLSKWYYTVISELAIFID